MKIFRFKGNGSVSIKTGWFLVIGVLIVIHRDIASAIKELLDTVNNVFKKYQYQNRRVSTTPTHTPSHCGFCLSFPYGQVILSPFLFLGSFKIKGFLYILANFESSRFSSDCTCLFYFLFN